MILTNDTTSYRKWRSMHRYCSSTGYSRFAFCDRQLFVRLVARWTFVLKKYPDSCVNREDLANGRVDFRKPQVDEFYGDQVNPLERWWRWYPQVGYKSITSLCSVWFTGILNRRLYAALYEFHNEDANIICNWLKSFASAQQQLLSLLKLTNN